MDRLESKCKGFRVLSQSNGKLDWPKRGIYYFFESEEHRRGSYTKLRVVRVGTHAVSEGSKSTLWGRLSSHKGNQKQGGGNHRGSIFRLLVGQALIDKRGLQNLETWGKGSSAKKEIRIHEEGLEKEVSQVIGRMPFLWLEIDIQPSKKSLRGNIERNSIALLSQFQKPFGMGDVRSGNWLGNYSNRDKVRASGLWNSNHIEEDYDPEFLDILEAFIEKA